MKDSVSEPNIAEKLIIKSLICEELYGLLVTGITLSGITLVSSELTAKKLIYFLKRKVKDSVTQENGTDLRSTKPLGSVDFFNMEEAFNGKYTTFSSRVFFWIATPIALHKLKNVKHVRTTWKNVDEGWRLM